jgi:hypothetical protein
MTILITDHPFNMTESDRQLSRLLTTLATATRQAIRPSPTLQTVEISTPVLTRWKRELEEQMKANAGEGRGARLPAEALVVQAFQDYARYRWSSEDRKEEAEVERDSFIKHWIETRHMPAAMDINTMELRDLTMQKDEAEVKTSSPEPSQGQAATEHSMEGGSQISLQPGGSSYSDQATFPEEDATIEHPVPPTHDQMTFGTTVAPASQSQKVKELLGLFKYPLEFLNEWGGEARSGEGGSVILQLDGAVEGDEDETWDSSSQLSEPDVWDQEDFLNSDGEGTITEDEADGPEWGLTDTEATTEEEYISEEEEGNTTAPGERTEVEVRRRSWSPSMNSTLVQVIQAVQRHEEEEEDWNNISVDLLVSTNPVDLSIKTEEEDWNEAPVDLTMQVNPVDLSLKTDVHNSAEEEEEEDWNEEEEAPKVVKVFGEEAMARRGYGPLPTTGKWAYWRPFANAVVSIGGVLSLEPIEGVNVDEAGHIQVNEEKYRQGREDWNENGVVKEGFKMDSEDWPENLAKKEVGYKLDPNGWPEDLAQEEKGYKMDPNDWENLVQETIGSDRPEGSTNEEGPDEAALNRPMIFVDDLAVHTHELAEGIQTFRVMIDIFNEARARVGGGGHYSDVNPDEVYDLMRGKVEQERERRGLERIDLEEVKFRTN